MSHLLEELFLMRCKVRPLPPQRLSRVFADGFHLLQFLQ
jgi:hypothetical protein